MSDRLTSAITTPPPSASGSKSLVPFQCRRGIRSLLRSTPSAANSQPPATDTPKSVSCVQNSAASSPSTFVQFGSLPLSDATVYPVEWICLLDKHRVH